MKSFLIKWILSAVLDLVINALVEMTRRTDNEVDDNMVRVIVDSRQELEDTIKRSL